MTAPLARLAAHEPSDFDDRRREPRFAALFEATLASARGERVPVLIADLSLHGCCLKSDAAWLRQGAFVSLGLDDHAMLTGIVRWLRDGAAGIEFLRPIPSERVEWHAMLERGF